VPHCSHSYDTFISVVACDRTLLFYIKIVILNATTLSFICHASATTRTAFFPPESIQLPNKQIACAIFFLHKRFAKQRKIAFDLQSSASLLPVLRETPQRAARRRRASQASEKNCPAWYTSRTVSRRSTKSATLQ